MKISLVVVIIRHHSSKIHSRKVSTAGKRPSPLPDIFFAWNENGYTESCKNCCHKYDEIGIWRNVRNKVVKSLGRLGCKTQCVPLVLLTTTANNYDNNKSSRKSINKNKTYYYYYYYCCCCCYYYYYYYNKINEQANQLTNKQQNKTIHENSNNPRGKKEDSLKHFSPPSNLKRVAFSIAVFGSEHGTSWQWLFVVVLVCLSIFLCLFYLKPRFTFLPDDFQTCMQNITRKFDVVPHLRKWILEESMSIFLHRNKLTFNFPVSVVRILISKIHSYNDWHENGWILFWNFKYKSVSSCRQRMKRKLPSKWV